MITRDHINTVLYGSAGLMGSHLLTVLNTIDPNVLIQAFGQLVIAVFTIVSLFKKKDR
jgi:hypothetical protein